MHASHGLIVASYARHTEKAEQQAWRSLDCKDEREIEIELGVPKSAVAEWVSEKRSSADFGAPESRQHFDVWSFQSADGSLGPRGAERSPRTAPGDRTIRSYTASLSRMAQPIGLNHAVSV